MPRTKYFSHKSKNNHQKLYSRLKKIMDQVQYNDRTEFENQLKAKQEICDRIMNFLYFHPLWSNIIIVSFVLSIFTIFGLLFKDHFKTNILFLILYVLVLYLIPIILIYITSKITPRRNFSWDEYWSKVLNQFLEIYGYNQKGKRTLAKIRLERARLYYEREGKPLSILTNLLFGGVFIGCLPDPKFHTYLLNADLKLFTYNTLGGTILLIIPFVFMYSFVKYQLPEQWIDNVIMQLDLSPPDTVE